MFSFKMLFFYALFSLNIYSFPLVLPLVSGSGLAPNGVWKKILMSNFGTCTRGNEYTFVHVWLDSFNHANSIMKISKYMYHKKNSLQAHENWKSICPQQSG